MSILENVVSGALMAIGYPVAILFMIGALWAIARLYDGAEIAVNFIVDRIAYHVFRRGPLADDNRE